MLKVNKAGGATTAVPNLLAAVKVVNGAYQAGAVDQKTGWRPRHPEHRLSGATRKPTTRCLRERRTITFESHAAPGAAIATTTATFAPSTDSTLLISGAERFGGHHGAARQQHLGCRRDGASVRFVNGSADVPAFDVAIDGVVKAANVAYTHASDYFNLDNSNHKVQLLVPGTTTAIFTVDQQQFGGGQVTTFYLVGPASALDQDDFAGQRLTGAARASPAPVCAVTLRARAIRGYTSPIGRSSSGAHRRGTLQAPRPRLDAIGSPHCLTTDPANIDYQ